LRRRGRPKTERVVFALVPILGIASGVAPYSKSVRPLAKAAANVPLVSEDIEPARRRSKSAEASEARDLLAVPGVLAGVSATRSRTPHTAALAVDGREDTAWEGAPSTASDSTWTWTARLNEPKHIALLRAKLGRSPTEGVPTVLHWEARARCDESDPFVAIADTAEDLPAATSKTFVLSTRRSWFVDVDACAIRLVIAKANGDTPPVLREIEAREGARDVLRDPNVASIEADAGLDGFPAENAIDGTYDRRWVGAPGRGRWTLTVRLAEPTPIDRVRLVLGYDATTTPRSPRIANALPPTNTTHGVGRAFGVAYAPLRYALEGSVDGVHFEPLHDGAPLAVRRPLFHLPRARPLRALRLKMEGATGAAGTPDAGASPVVREIAAYRADDPAKILAPPWVLSVNANPAGLSHPGELGNDVYFAKFLQMRFWWNMPTMRRDDRYYRSLGPRGEWIDAPGNDASGSALEAIEGDDPTFDTTLLTMSYPRPIVVLSGSNSWEFARKTGPDGSHPRWRWNPVKSARRGGMGQIHDAVKKRVAPFLGFCGGAQILALLEARHGTSSIDDAFESGEDGSEIDEVLRRSTGRPIRGWAPASALERAWPGEKHPRTEVVFDPRDTLFADIAGASLRSRTREMPESHFDVVRPDAFLPDGPLRRFEVLATSVFCGPDVIAAGPHDLAVPSPDGKGRCATVTEAFRSRDAGFPIIGTQFHAEQNDFVVPSVGDPPESTADPRLFVGAAYESIVDAYVRYGE